MKQSVSEAAARKRRRLEREWVLKGDVLDKALAIFVLGDYAPEPIVVFLRSVGRQHHWDSPKTDNEVLEIVENAFLAADFWELVSI